MQTSKSYAPPAADNQRSLKLNCFSFLQNGFIPPRYTSDGININPSIYIDGIPAQTQSLAIIVEDPDVPHDSFCHWLAWNIPVTSCIKEKENRGISGINDFGNHAYNGPHPFSITHRYFFYVFALDCFLNLSASATRTELKKAMKGHIASQGMLIGKYKKQSIPMKNIPAQRTKVIPGESLKALLNERGTCLSLILSVHQQLTGQSGDQFHFKKAIKEAVATLAEKNLPGTAQLFQTLEKLEKEIIVHPGDRGIGIYCSKDMGYFTTFPFEVTEKRLIEEGFHVKELLIKEQYALPYTVLYIEDKEIRLYNGKLNQLAEVKNKELPLFFEEAAEQPSGSYFTRNGLTKNGDRNGSEAAKEKRQAVYNKADELLHLYLQHSEALVVCGERKYLTGFMNSTAHAGRITSILYGNYNRFTESDFGEMVWPIIQSHASDKMAEEIEECNEKMSTGLTEQGIVHVWDAVLSDRGSTLLVEKNFSVKGYVEDPLRLFLHPTKNTHTVLEDAVNDLIKTALAKDVRIVFVEDGMLNRNMRMALVTEY